MCLVDGELQRCVDTYAYRALSSWKIQQKSAQVNILLDELINEVNEFIRHSALPAQLINLAHMRFEAYIGCKRQLLSVLKG